MRILNTKKVSNLDSAIGKYYNIIESLVSVFTIDKGEVKVLLIRKKSDPYKGYWILPGDIVSKEETIEENVIRAMNTKLGFQEVYLEECSIYSDINRDSEERIIAVSYIGLIDNVSALIKRKPKKDIETSWFKINDIPKMAYDHFEILEKNIEFLRTKIIQSNVLKGLFPSDFTLPELQRTYEQILNVTFDRRNFRKKFITLGLIEDTGDTNVGGNGRPAKLYRFKDEIKERNLF